MKQKANLVPEEFYLIFYAIHNYYIFSNIDSLQIRELMPYIFNIYFVFVSCKYFFKFFLLLIVRCANLFENIM